MEYDTTKLDEGVLALLYFNAHTDHGVTRAWKGFDWDTLDRLHAQGFISDPKSKAKLGRLERRRGAEGGGVVRRYFAKAV